MIEKIAYLLTTSHSLPSEVKQTFFEICKTFQLEISSFDKSKNMAVFT